MGTEAPCPQQQHRRKGARAVVVEFKQVVDAKAGTHQGGEHRLDGVPVVETAMAVVGPRQGQVGTGLDGTRWMGKAEDQRRFRVQYPVNLSEDPAEVGYPGELEHRHHDIYRVGSHRGELGEIPLIHLKVQARFGAGASSLGQKCFVGLDADDLCPTASCDDGQRART